MTDLEKLMYEIICCLSEIDAPIICKGALVTKSILSESGFRDVIRDTKDIDVNWTSSAPSMSYITDTINSALAKLPYNLHATAEHDYIIGKMTAGVDIRDNNDILILSMDIDIKQAVGSRLYHYGDASFRGVLPTEVIADKIAAVSDRKVFWRIKDLIDLYALSCCIELKTDEIYKVIDSKGLQINDFTPFLEQVSGKQGIEYAYNRLNGVEGKPPFETVYARLKAFLMPFIEHDRTTKVWNAETAKWE
jgi:hypothetical protein